MDGWLWDEQIRFSDFAGTLPSLFCFPVCSHLPSSLRVPGASPTCMNMVQYWRIQEEKSALGNTAVVTGSQNENSHSRESINFPENFFGLKLYISRSKIKGNSESCRIFPFKQYYLFNTEELV